MIGLRRGRTTAVVVALLACALPSFAQRGWQAYQDPYERFAVRHPSSWRAFFGIGATLAVIAEKDGKATVFIEYLRLQQPLDSARDYDLIVQIERDLIAERVPKAEQIAPLAARPELPGVVALEFTRPGLKGADRVRQFSVVNGTDLFRILCVAPAPEFGRFTPIFDQLVRSFTAAPTPPPPAQAAPTRP